MTHIGGRFNFGRDINDYQFPPFPALYIGSSHEVALAERLPHPFAPSPLSDNELALAFPNSYSYYVLSGSIHRVLDITSAKSLRKATEIFAAFEKDKSIDDLARLVNKVPIPLVKHPGDLKKILHEPNWRGAPTQVNLPASCQVFGKLVRDAGVEGILYNSTKVKSGKCLAIFPENLQGSPSSVTLADDVPETLQCKTLNKNTWKDLV